MKKLPIIISLIIFALGCVYLLTPSKNLPELSNSTLSDEPGDTWQNPDQKAYYTNHQRSEVMTELTQDFSIQIFGITIPPYRLNYRPEETEELVREQIPSYYLEEIVYPFRNSVFVNGWEPMNAPVYRNLNRDDVPQLNFKGKTYLSKVTLKPVDSPIWARILVWFLVFPATYITFVSIKRSIKHGKN